MKHRKENLPFEMNRRFFRAYPYTYSEIVCNRLTINLGTFRIRRRRSASEYVIPYLSRDLQGFLIRAIARRMAILLISVLRSVWLSCFTIFPTADIIIKVFHLYP